MRYFAYTFSVPNTVRECCQTIYKAPFNVFMLQDRCALFECREMLSLLNIQCLILVWMLLSLTCRSIRLSIECLVYERVMSQHRHHSADLYNNDFQISKTVRRGMLNFISNCTAKSNSSNLTQKLLIISYWLWILFWTVSHNTLKNYIDNARNDIFSVIFINELCETLYAAYKGHYHVTI